MSTTTINLTIPKALLAEVDKFAQDEHTSRSDIFRVSVLEKLRKNRAKAHRDQQDLVHAMLAEAERLESMNVSDKQILDSVMSLRRSTYRQKPLSA
jgi:metal-responsive CopG/Arc/MetJ family transcriptional regulator